MSTAGHEAAISVVQAVRFDAPSLAYRDDADILALLREVAVATDRPHGYLATRGYSVDETRVLVRESSRLHRITQAALDE